MMLGAVLEPVISSLNVTTILLLVVSILAYAWYRSVSRPAGFPPGPTALPLVGNILSIRGPLYKVFNDFSKQYGDIFSIKIGPNWCVVLNNNDVAKDAFLRKPVEFAGRPKSFSIDIISSGYRDVLFSSYSETWKLHRKIAHAAIRHFATGEKLDQLVYKVLPQLSHAIDANEGQSFDAKEVLAVFVYNLLATLLFGHEYSFGDPKLKWFMNFDENFVKVYGSGLPADLIPILKHFPNARTKTVVKLLDKYNKALGVELKSHKETYNPENIRDLIDSLMKAQQDAIDEGSAKVDSLTDTHLILTVADMFAAGTDTTTSTLHWAVALMAKHPDIQEKVAQEVDSIIGRDRLPSIKDRGELPYTEAALYEVMRYSSVAPVCMTRATMEDVTLGDYRIPKDTWVMANLWAIHYSEKHWDEPHKFKPEHFLDESGEVRQHPNGFLPFSFGHRVCLGESFAKAELFLVFSWLFQRYTFSKPPEQEGEFEYKLDPQRLIMARQLHRYQIVAKKRY